MRHLLLALCTVLAASLPIHAASNLDAGAAAAPTILVVPFVTTSDGSNPWVGKAVQQDLLTELTHGTLARVMAPTSAAPAADAATALKAARDQSASIVIYGQAQLVGPNVRLTGQILDVSSGAALGAVKVTGPFDDLFHLEDALAGQVLTVLPRSLLTVLTQEGLPPPPVNIPQSPEAAPLDIEPVPSPIIVPVQPGPQFIEPAYQQVPGYASLPGDNYFCPFPIDAYAWGPFGAIPFYNSVGIIAVGPEFGRRGEGFRDRDEHRGRGQTNEHFREGGRPVIAVGPGVAVGPSVQAATPDASDPVVLRFTWGNSTSAIGGRGFVPPPVVQFPIGGGTFGGGGFAGGGMGGPISGGGIAARGFRPMGLGNHFGGFHGGFAHGGR